MDDTLPFVLIRWIFGGKERGEALRSRRCHGEMETRWRKGARITCAAAAKSRHADRYAVRFKGEMLISAEADLQDGNLIVLDKAALF